MTNLESADSRSFNGFWEQTPGPPPLPTSRENKCWKNASSSAWMHSQSQKYVYQTLTSDRKQPMGVRLGPERRSSGWAEGQMGFCQECQRQQRISLSVILQRETWRPMEIRIAPLFFFPLLASKGTGYTSLLNSKKTCNGGCNYKRANIDCQRLQHQQLLVKDKIDLYILTSRVGMNAKLECCNAIIRPATFYFHSEITF